MGEVLIRSPTLDRWENLSLHKVVHVVIGDSDMDPGQKIICLSTKVTVLNSQENFKRTSLVALAQQFTGTFNYFYVFIYLFLLKIAQYPGWRFLEE